MSTQTLEISSDSTPLLEPQTASPNQANICSLDDLFLLNSEDLGQYLAKQTAGILLRVETLRPYYIELWKRFDELKDGETICGCTTRKEYCKEILHRSMRSIQYVLYGRNETKQLPAPTPEPIPSDCPVCEEPQTSRGAWGRHIRESHPDEADSILGKQVVPEQPKRINKHLVGAEVGDNVLYNSSRGTCSGVIVAINDKEVTIQTGKTDKSIKRLPLDVDCDTIRSSTKTREKLRASAVTNPSTPLINMVTETFYVIRRKSDGQYASGGYIPAALEYAIRFEKPREIQNHWKNKLAEFGDREWVKVQAAYTLTAVSKE